MIMYYCVSCCLLVNQRNLNVNESKIKSYSVLVSIYGLFEPECHQAKLTHANYQTIYRSECGGMRQGVLLYAFKMLDINCISKVVCILKMKNNVTY